MINYIRIYHAVPLIPSAPTSCAPHSMACALNMKNIQQMRPVIAKQRKRKNFLSGHNFSLFRWYVKFCAFYSALVVDSIRSNSLHFE